MPDVWGLAAIASKFLLYLGVLTSAGTVAAAVLFRIPNVRSYAAACALLGLIGAVLGFSLRGAALTGDAGGMVDAEMLGLLWTTPVGTALACRVAGLGLVMLGLVTGSSGLWLSSAGGLLALWSFATVGHVPDPDAAWLRAVLLFHLAAVALWIGILTPLRQLADGGSASQAASLADRFGRVASVFVPLLVLAGIVMSYILVGSVEAMIATSYGRFLMLKTALVAGLLALAALNKLRFVPQIMAGNAVAASHLSRSIRLEWVFVIAILLVTAILTSGLSVPA